MPRRNTLEESRRSILKACSAVVAGAAAPTFLGSPKMVQAAERSRGVKKGRIKQSVVGWCFMEGASPSPWSLERLCQETMALGIESTELHGPEQWPMLKRYGLLDAIAIVDIPGPSAAFTEGFNNPRYRAKVVAATKKRIDDCAASGGLCNKVIAFSGHKWRYADVPTSGEISREEGAENCIEGFKEVVGYAEKNRVTLCFEMLSTRDETHPMKGHPGYQGNDLDWVVAIIRAVGSRALTLLFDAYHVQVMHGDIIRRLGECQDILGHVHVAGNPGRGELDDTQEMNYPPIMRKLIEIGYDGFVGQEFIPTRDPVEGLREAVEVCDV